MDQLLRGARFVVFPSVYEGFGIPVVKSLAYGKPILARSIPTTCAIKEKLGDDENLILYSSTEDLVHRLRQGFPQWRDGTVGHGYPDGSWDAVTAQIGDFLCRVSRSVSFEDVLIPRLRHMRLLEEKEQFQARARAALAKSASAGSAAGAEAVAQAASEEILAALRDRDAQIQDIYHSWSWRVTSPLRRMADLYLRFRRRA
jgi:hypothetical protein